MKVTLIAFTQIAANEAGTDITDEWMVSEFGPDHHRIPSADHLAEFAGRACYQSFHRPNEKTASNEAYLRNIIVQRHESVLEHASVTFYIEGISRSLTHELIRHRHFSYSQLSQRFVDADKGGFQMVYPPATRNDPDLWQFDAAIGFIRNAYVDVYDTLRKNGLDVKQAREAARAILPNMMETKIVVTGNHRAWREFLFKRLSPTADAEIQELALAILAKLREIAPNTYQDFNEVET